MRKILHLHDQGLDNTDDNFVGLSQAKNIDFYPGGIKRRGGWAKIVDLPDTSSMAVASDSFIVFQSEGKLYILDSVDYSYEYIADIIQTNQISCEQVGGGIFWSNGAQIGKITISAHTNTFFIKKPKTFTIVKAPGIGGLSSGDYICCLSYTSDDGREGPSSEKVILSVSDGDGVYFSWGDVAQVNTETGVNFHISKMNAGTLYVAKSVDFISGADYYQGNPLELDNLSILRDSEMPASTKLIVWGGSLVTAVDGKVYYSSPDEFEVREKNNFIPFSDRVKALAPLSSKKLLVGLRDGIYVLSQDWTYEKIFDGVDIFDEGISKITSISVKSELTNYTQIGVFLLSPNSGPLFLGQNSVLYNLTPKIFFYPGLSGYNCRVAARENQCYSIHF